MCEKRWSLSLLNWNRATVFERVMFTEKTGLWDGSIHVLRPTDDVHQMQEFICMHDFAPNPGFDPAMPTSETWVNESASHNPACGDQKFAKYT